MSFAIGIIFGILILVVWGLRAASTNTLRIESPKVGLLNLDGEGLRPLVTEDRVWLTSLFSSVEELSQTTISCDVLFIYGQIEASGRFRSSELSLRQIIAQARARVVIVASENSSDSYISAGKLPGAGRANLVMALERKGASFGHFFGALFAKMKSGTSMPIAWVSLAPQIPGQDHFDTPGTIFACEVGQLAFK